MKEELHNDYLGFNNKEDLIMTEPAYDLILEIIHETSIIKLYTIKWSSESIVAVLKSRLNSAIKVEETMFIGSFSIDIGNHYEFKEVVKALLSIFNLDESDGRVLYQTSIKIENPEPVWEDELYVQAVTWEEFEYNYQHAITTGISLNPGITIV